MLVEFTVSLHDHVVGGLNITDAAGNIGDFFFKSTEDNSSNNFSDLFCVNTVFDGGLKVGFLDVLSEEDEGGSFTEVVSGGIEVSRF